MRRRMLCKVLGPTPGTFHILRAAPQKPARDRTGNRRKLPVDTPVLALVVSRHTR